MREIIIERRNMGIDKILDKKADYSDDLDKYNSRFDFEKFEITDRNIIFDLTTKEERIVKNLTMIKRNTFEFSKTLYEAQKLLSNHKTGVFIAWFTNLGLNKNVVYRAIDKYELVLETNNKSVLNLPYRVIDIIKKSELSNKEKNEIVKIEDSKQIIQTISDLNSKKENSEIISIKENIDVKNEIQKLKEKREKLYEKIQDIDNQISVYNQNL